MTRRFGQTGRGLEWDAMRCTNTVGTIRVDDDDDNVLMFIYYSKALEWHLAKCLHAYLHHFTRFSLCLLSLVMMLMVFVVSKQAMPGASLYLVSGNRQAAVPVHHGVSDIGRYRLRADRRCGH